MEYNMKGRIVKELFPPPGFRPESASASQLDEYGFPPRPTDPAQLARWQDEMGRWTGTVPAAPFLAETHATVSGVTSSPTADTVKHSIWAGYVVTAEPNSLDSFSHAEGWYVEPTMAASRCPNPSEVTWAGLGGYYDPYNGGWLAQNGTGWNVPGLGAHQAWWEIVPENGITPVPNFYGTPGQVFDASVRNIGNAFRFWFMNYQTGKSTVFDEPYPSSNAHSAEVIIERPSINGVAADLANFQTWYVYQSEAWINFFTNGTTFDNFPPNLNSAGLWRHGLHMYNYSTGKYYAEPSSILAPGQFSVTQESCDGT